VGSSLSHSLKEICRLPTPKRPFRLPILHHHRNPSAIVAIIKHRDLQPAVGAKAWCCRQVGDRPVTRVVRPWPPSTSTRSGVSAWRVAPPPRPARRQGPGRGQGKGAV